MQLLQILGGVTRGLMQQIAEPVRDRIEPLVDGCCSCDWPCDNSPIMASMRAAVSAWAPANSLMAAE